MEYAPFFWEILKWNMRLFLARSGISSKEPFVRGNKVCHTSTKYREYSLKDNLIKRANGN